MKSPNAGPTRTLPLTLAATLCSLAVIPVTQAGGPSDRGGGIGGTVTCTQNGVTETLSGPAGLLRNACTRRIELANEPISTLIDQKMEEISAKAPDFAADLREAAKAKIWKLDGKPASQECEAGLGTIMFKMDNPEIYACQDSVEIRLSDTWWSNPSTPDEHRVVIAVHEMAMGMNLARPSDKRVSYDELTGIDSIIYSVAQLEEDDFLRQLNAYWHLDGAKAYPSAALVAKATAAGTAQGAELKATLCKAAPATLAAQEFVEKNVQVLLGGPNEISQLETAQTQYQHHHHGNPDSDIAAKIGAIRQALAAVTQAQKIAIANNLQGELSQQASEMRHGWGQYASNESFAANNLALKHFIAGTAAAETMINRWRSDYVNFKKDLPSFCGTQTQ